MTEDTTQADGAFSRLTAELGMIAQRFTNDVIEQKEALVKQAISRHIGTEWNLDDLVGRVHKTKSPNTCEVYYLDGEPIIKFIETGLREQMIGGRNMLTNIITHEFIVPK